MSIAALWLVLTLTLVGEVGSSGPQASRRSLADTWGRRAQVSDDNLSPPAQLAEEVFEPHPEEGQRQGLFVKPEERADGEDGEDEAKAVHVDVIIACVLLGSSLFIMTVFLLVNNPDPDIKLHSYMVLSFTVSIFIALLVFHSMADVLNGFLESSAALRDRAGAKLCISVVIKLLEALGWYAGLQVVIWHFVSGIAEQRDGAQWSKEVSNQATAWCTLLMHIAAFSAISGLRDLQALMTGGGASICAFFAVVISVAVCFGLFRLADWVRSTIEVPRQAHETWDAVVEEAENDLAGLTVSCTAVQAFIDCVVGQSVSGQQRHLNLRDKSELGALFMFGIAILSACMTVLVTQLISRREKTPGGAAGRAWLHQQVGGFVSHAGLDTIMVYLRRWLFILQTICAMSFAWCMLFSAKWQLAKFLGSGGGLLHSESTGQSVVLALVASFTACALIFLIGKLQDLDITGDVLERCSRSIMGALGVLIGYPWEMAFNRGIEVIAEAAKAQGYWFPILLKFAFGLVIALVLLPAWRTHILKVVLDMDEENAERQGRTIRRAAMQEEHTRIMDMYPEVDQEEVTPTWFCFGCSGPAKRKPTFN